MIYDSTLAGGFTRTGQMMFINTHGDTLPMVNPQHHLNGTVEVVFMDKVVNALPGSDTLFIWDPVGKSCSNVLCHGNGDPNSPLFKKTFWR